MSTSMTHSNPSFLVLCLSCSSAGANSGGNPPPVWLAADDLSTEEMQERTRASGHESAFVLAPSNPATHGFRMRYFVPKHEMEMCGHATIGALLAAARARELWDGEPVRIETQSSGTVEEQLPARHGRDQASHGPRSRSWTKRWSMRSPTAWASSASRSSARCSIRRPAGVKTLVSLRTPRGCIRCAWTSRKVEGLCARLALHRPLSLRGGGRPALHRQRAPVSARLGLPRGCRDRHAPPRALAWGLREAVGGRR